MRWIERSVVVLLLLCLSVALKAAPAARIEFAEETLDNGLRVIYAPLRQAPVVHVRVLYHVGSRDERPDRQGFAHMFEHMMFRGSAHVEPEEHMRRIGIAGGISNAFTSFDQTVYVNTIPSEYLEMTLWLEADRMASFKVSEEIYETERRVVAEEWRMRQNRPYGNMYEEFLKRAFQAHSYRWTPIGNMDHLRAAPVHELQEFFNTYYVPNNAVLVIAGDIELEQAQAMVRRYFQWIPAGDAPPRNIPAEPQQAEPRVETIQQPVPLPAILMGWKIPAFGSDDHEALSLLSTILGDGESSRIVRLLVNGETPMAVNAYSIHMQLQDHGVFGAGAVVMRDKDPQTVQDMLTALVRDVRENGVTEQELEKARTRQRVAMIYGLQTAENLASQLGNEALFADDPHRVNTVLQRIEGVTREQIRDVARRWLKPEAVTILRVNPGPRGPDAVTELARNVDEAPAPVAPRVVQFPEDYPRTAPTAQPRQNPEFAKGVETQVNGVRVIVMEDSRLPLVNWSLTMRRGSHSEPHGKEGTAMLTSDLIRRGVEGLNYQQLSDDLDARRISISVSDGGDHTRMTGSCATEHLDHAWLRTRQILLTPTFPDDEFAKLKEQSINSLRVQEENPSSVASNELTAALYGDSVLGRFPTPRTVESITLDDTKAFYQEVYRPDDAIMVISGDVTVERGRELAQQLLADWSPAPAPTIVYDVPAPSVSRRIIVVDRPDARQSTVRMGIRAYDIQSEEKFAGSIAGQILTAGIDSRLGKYVRAERGLAYSVYGLFRPTRQAGAFAAATDTSIETTADAVEAMFKVFREMRDNRVTDQELSEARQRVTGSMVMQMQTIGQQAQYRVDGILNGYPIDYYDRYPQRIAQVSADEVRTVMDTYVRDEAMTIIVVAPAEQVKQQLERLGTVEVVPMPTKRESEESEQRKAA